MANYNLGKFVMTPRGSYSASATYNRLDFVLYQGSSYVCKSDSTKNKLPTNTTYWQQIAAAGQATMTEAQKQEIISGILEGGVVIDPDYNTFSTSEKEKLANLSAANNGTITIKRNGTTVGSFTTDQSANSNINITVPTTASELNDYGQLLKVLELTSNNRDTEVTIPDLKLGAALYYHLPLTAFKIEGLGYDPADINAFAKSRHTFIYFTAGADFNITLPSGCVCNSLACHAGMSYKIEVEGNYFTLTEYTPIV